MLPCYRCCKHLAAAPQVVNELRLECAERDSIGRKRTGAAVAWSLQRYLIFALLSCIPGTTQVVCMDHSSFKCVASNSWPRCSPMCLCCL